MTSRIRTITRITIAAVIPPCGGGPYNPSYDAIKMQVYWGAHVEIYFLFFSSFGPFLPFSKVLLTPSSSLKNVRLSEVQHKE